MTLSLTFNNRSNLFFLNLDQVPELLHSFILTAIKFSFASNLVDSMYKHLSHDENLNKCEESWDVLARRHLLEEDKILEKCKETGQVAGVY
jgi:hypothetical protein